MSDTKQAEKEYLARAGSSEWERVKPFSPAGSETLDESARLLHDFSVAMLTLRPEPGELILDLGAGGCWCSDLLTRLNRRAVAVDISVDMLRAGRARANGAGILAAAGDLERLPFRSGTFGKAVCLNALHHVPDMGAALAEVGRVLTDHGTAFFSEPGAGHADEPVSTTAMRDFGVLEQEVRIPEFVEACRAAGFADVRIKPMSYAVPEFDLTPDQWQNWSALAGSKRPARAMQKIGRGVAELLGAGKQTTLFEEAFAIGLVRMLRQVVDHHPVIVASKSAVSARVRATWMARIDLGEMPTRGKGGQPFRATAVLTNTGSTTWGSTAASGTGHVSLGIQVLAADGRLVDRDHQRVPLPVTVAPSEQTAVTFDCRIPDAPGDWQLKFDLVAEGVTWFEAVGSPAPVRPFVVEP
jgi:SAM-dependent methyltransferase